MWMWMHQAACCWPRKSRLTYSLGSSVHLSGCSGFTDICAYKYFIAVIVAIHSFSLVKIGSLKTLDMSETAFSLEAAGSLQEDGEMLKRKGRSCQKSS